jgi:hypothetical protein
MRKKLLHELNERSSFEGPVDHHANDQRLLFSLPPNRGWTHENKRHVQRELGIVTDAFAGPDERGHHWASFQFWSFEAGGEALDATILARAVGHWVKEGTQIRLFVIGRYVDGAQDLGVEVRFRVGAPGEKEPIFIDDEFDLAFSEALFVIALDRMVRESRGEHPKGAWSWTRQPKGTS